MSGDADERKELSITQANLRELAGTPAGKDFIWQILDICNLYGDNFSGNSTTFYLEGKRAVGLEVLAMLEDADPTIYPRLLLEKINESE